LAEFSNRFEVKLEIRFGVPEVGRRRKVKPLLVQTYNLPVMSSD